MKICGHSKVEAPTERVHVGSANGQPVYLTLHAPSFSAIREIYDRMPIPEAPAVGVQRDERGRQLRRPDGKPLVERDYEDPEYLRRKRDVNHARLAATILACTNGEIEPDTRREDHPDLVSYHLAVLSEMEEAGLSVGAIRRIEDAVARLSALTEDELASAQKALGGGGDEASGEAVPPPSST